MKILLLMTFIIGWAQDNDQLMADLQSCPKNSRGPLGSLHRELRQRWFQNSPPVTIYRSMTEEQSKALEEGEMLPSRNFLTTGRHRGTILQESFLGRLYRQGKGITDASLNTLDKSPWEPVTNSLTVACKYEAMKKGHFRKAGETDIWTAQLPRWALFDCKLSVECEYMLHSGESAQWKRLNMDDIREKNGQYPRETYTQYGYLCVDGRIDYSKMPDQIHPLAKMGGVGYSKKPAPKKFQTYPPAKEDEQAYFDYKKSLFP